MNSQRVIDNLIIALVIAIIAGGLYFLISPVGATITLNSSHGEKWIRWEWESDPQYQVYNVIVDEDVRMNYTSNHIILSGVESGTLHNILVWNGTDEAYAEITTDTPIYLTTFFFLLILFALFVILAKHIALLMWGALIASILMVFEAFLNLGNIYLIILAFVCLAASAMSLQYYTTKKHR